MSFSYTFASFLQSKKAILTKFLIICQNPDKFQPKCKFLASNNEAILT